VRARLLPLALILLAPLAVGGVVWAYLSGDDPSPSTAPLAAAGAPHTAFEPPDATSLQARSPAPLDFSTAGTFDPALRREPRAALVFDVDTGEVLYRRHERRELPVASLTKVMTALLVTQATEPGERCGYRATSATRARRSGSCRKVAGFVWSPCLRG
jgi:serine-type D-Ala-D-Ala carboxypeptidase (penicillin-binding protein 5/6)